MTTPDRAAKKDYDGAHYRAVTFYVCDCGFSEPCGQRLADDGYEGGAVMLEHLKSDHGWVYGVSNASYHGDWGTDG